MKSVSSVRQILRSLVTLAALTFTPGAIAFASEDGISTLVLNNENCRAETLMNGVWKPSDGIVCYAHDANLRDAILFGHVQSADPGFYQVTPIETKGGPALRIVVTFEIPFAGPRGYVAAFHKGIFRATLVEAQPVDPGDTGMESF